MKKLAIIGRGTAGCYAAAHFNKWTDWEIDWYFDENIKPQAVGEGSDISFSRNLTELINFRFHDLDKVDGYYKTAIYKEGWGKEDNKFFHNFLPPSLAIHFNAVKMQEYIMEYLKHSNKINYKIQNITHKDIDSDFIMDCSGFSNDHDKFNMLDTIPVNSVYVTQCFWDHPTFDYTMTIARPHGWVFCIPLKNRCSVGYLYNKNISSLDQVKEDVGNIFDQCNLVPSETTNQFSFKNYYRKNFMEGRAAYNGNAGFFLEPLEATSIATMEQINRNAFDYWMNNLSMERSNEYCLDFIQKTEDIIMLHYAAGSIYESDFWSFAEERGLSSFQKMLKKPDYNIAVMNEKSNYGPWSSYSFVQNLPNLGLPFLDPIKSFWTDSSVGRAADS